MIKQAFLDDVANYINTRIKKIRLNDSYLIDQFVVKQVQQSTVTMEFLVPFGSVEVIDKIDLIDQENQVISTNSVTVPITSDTVILQSFEVKEDKA
ncbi:hypothetical protein [Amphibacillus sediminis]|uniref:hypothetical protein n=1 Tax=Amphibacillus sediminis TaxID=360185 RepID=UPI0008295A22|nr:hypothetical protein [Amphibacillus sediminis]